MDGVSFKTICASCNSGLGGKHDKALASLCFRISKLLKSKLMLASPLYVRTQPNLVYRAVLAHLLSANDGGAPMHFDQLTRSVVTAKSIGKREVTNLYMWVYSGDDILILRDVAAMDIGGSNVHIMNLLKFYPLAFLATEQYYPGLLNLRAFISMDDEAECTLPIDLSYIDTHPFRPAYAEGNRIILAGAHTSVHATRLQHKAATTYNILEPD